MGLVKIQPPIIIIAHALFACLDSFASDKTDSRPACLASTLRKKAWFDFLIAAVSKVWDSRRLCTVFDHRPNSVGIQSA